MQVTDQNGGATYEIYDAADRMLIRVDPDGKRTRKIYMGNQLIASDKEGTREYVHFDTLGSTIAVSNSSKVLTFENYFQFGEKVYNASANNDQWFTGKKLPSITASYSSSENAARRVPASPFEESTGTRWLVPAAAPRVTIPGRGTIIQEALSEMRGFFCFRDSKTRWRVLAAMPAIVGCSPAPSASSDVQAGHWPELKLRPVTATGYGKDPNLIISPRSAWPRLLEPAQLNLVAVLTNILIPRDGIFHLLAR